MRPRVALACAALALTAAACQLPPPLNNLELPNRHPGPAPIPGTAQCVVSFPLDGHLVTYGGSCDEARNLARQVAPS